MARSTLRYISQQQNDDELRLALIRLAKQYGRYGYRKVCKLLQAEGWRVSQEDRATLARGRPAASAPAQEAEAAVPYRFLAHLAPATLYEQPLDDRLRPRQAEQRAPLHDAHLARRIYPRGLLGDVGTNMGASEVLEALYPLLLKRGQPAHLRSDNGPEFSAAPFRQLTPHVRQLPR